MRSSKRNENVAEPGEVDLVRHDAREADLLLSVVKGA
jgi:hypothetical protein